MIWESHQEIFAINRCKESETDTVVDLPVCVLGPSQDPFATQPFVFIVCAAPEYLASQEQTLQGMGCRVVGV